MCVPRPCFFPSLNSLVEESAMFLSRSTSSVHEKSLSDAEIEDLLDKTEDAVQEICNDTKRKKDERETAENVLSWIQDVRNTWEKEGSLHPDVVVKLMKTHTGVNLGRYGCSCLGGGFRRTLGGDRGR